MQSLARRVEQQQHAPRRREGEARDYRRRVGARAQAAIDEEAAAVESADTDAGARAAADRLGEIGAGEAHAVQAGERRSDGQSELRAGAEAGMLRARLVDNDARAGRQIERRRGLREITQRALGAGSARARA